MAVFSSEVFGLNTNSAVSPLDIAGEQHYAVHMRNTVKLRGRFLDYKPYTDRNEFAVRVHSDASFNNQAFRGLGSSRHFVGYGYCVELAPYAAGEAVPAYGYDAVEQNVNNCSLTAELIGVLGMLRATGLRDNVEIVCDNRDAVNVLNHMFAGEPVKNFQTNVVLRNVLRELEEFADCDMSARWVRGHNGDMYNHAVNMLARLARKTAEQGRPMQDATYKETNMLATFKRMSTDCIV